MAPGLNGRQTGTLPKNKPKNSGSQSHRLAREQLIQSAFLDWEPESELGNKKRSRKKSSTTHSETEVDCMRYDLGRSRSSTMTSQNENGEGCSQDSSSNKMNLPDRKQVVSKLSLIQTYLQETTSLMNALKTSDSPAQKAQYDKLAVMLEDLKDSEAKLTALLNKMDTTESRIDSLLTNLEEQPCNENGESRRMQKFTRIVNDNYGPIMCNSNMGSNNVEADEEELTRRSEESKKKLEVLQKRKQDLLKLQEKAKKQLQEAQAEQSRLVARASSLNQELAGNKLMDLNVQQLSQRLKAVQQIYNTRNQINGTLADSRRPNRAEADQPDEDNGEVSDTETDFQVVADKMEELNAMKNQIAQMQKIMSSLNGVVSEENSSRMKESGDDGKEGINQNPLNVSNGDVEPVGGDGNNNVMKLEQAKNKLNHLTQLLEIVQSAQNSNGLSPSYLQLVSNLVNDEAGSSTHSPSPANSVKSPQRNSEDLSVETMQVMTRELEERTAAMKEERDRLVAARQELQNMARKHPLIKPEDETLTPDEDSESEAPCLKPAAVDAHTRDLLNGSITEQDQSNCNDGNLYLCRASQPRGKHRGTWNPSLPISNSSTQERRWKNETLSRGSNQSSRGGSRSMGREQPRWRSPSPSISYSNERNNPVIQTQSQLEMSGNLCELMLAESLQRDASRSSDISLPEMFSQHQMLTRTVSQCSQLLWLQQKQIMELRNAFVLQFGTQPQSLIPNQSQVHFFNPLTFSATSSQCSNLNQTPSVTMQQQQPQQHQNCPQVNQNVKLNAGDMQNIHLSQHDLSDQFWHPGNQTTSLPYMNHPEPTSYDMRYGNFNRFNPPNSNSNHNSNQNTSSGSNNRVPNGINCLGPEDSRALNNQVPPGNRANNYWDNFRSYSRQNLLSNSKSNEDTDTSRRLYVSLSQDRPPRELLLPPLSQNNQVIAGSSQQPVQHHGNSESVSSDQYLLPPSQNSRANHHNQVTRSRSVEPQSLRISGKNESRHQDNVSVSGGARTRNSECLGENIRSVRNDVSQGARNLDNLNSTRNYSHLVRDFDNEENSQGNNKKRLERTRGRNDSRGNLNNRGYYNSSLWENIYSEVSNFIRANEARPHFLIQLFRDLQQVNNDNLRQRMLDSIQETVSANNLTERSSNMNGGNVNLIENRNNIRENRSNLNRNQSDDPNRIDEFFCHLRENQNTIRQNIRMSSFMLGCNNLENPNISNIRDLGSSRNNLENEGLRDLRTYFEANLCNFGHNSALENPNLSNIRENLTRRGPGVSEYENVHPKNVYLSIYDNAAMESRRRNQESPVTDFGNPYRNYGGMGNGYVANEFPVNNETVRGSNYQFELENDLEGPPVGVARHFHTENRSNGNGIPILDGGDNLGSSRQFLENGNDSGIDINFNNDERKRGFVEEGAVADGTVKSKKNVAEQENEVEGAASLIHPMWEREGTRDASFDSSLSPPGNYPAFMPLCENPFFNCSTFQPLDNGDLAEADQSRNEETPGVESDAGFVNRQIVEQEQSFTPETDGQDFRTGYQHYANQNIPESDRNFLESQKCENFEEVEGASAAEPEENSTFPNSASEPEGNFTRGNDDRSSEGNDEFYLRLKASSSSETNASKSGVKHQRRIEEVAAERENSAEEGKKSSSSHKKTTNQYRNYCYGQGKFDSDDEAENRNDSDSAASVVDGCQRTESGDSINFVSYRRPSNKTGETERGNTSSEAEIDWESRSGLDQVPTRLNESGSSTSSKSD